MNIESNAFTFIELKNHNLWLINTTVKFDEQKCTIEVLYQMVIKIEGMLSFLGDYKLVFWY